ncbi:RNA polymerase subunit AC19 [Coemansia sp. RSA 1807]|nr:RNA polymerase subunit AC19 [Coemansia sp. RSA 1591]KAJ1754432.1 RNA polymerase subunit AC19 [Coemansia sp. RSA 1752]KAJ1778842.1 RNA polymerase subunit AC19 [Coemansia sp. RSA 1824]KAJ1781827.1 RNA polymerase subunit AC19 [Coemansia sp. RSA 1938]KAJ2134084.1 RNA polymerase subunit AC19 [Coemansia sp. RSA 788]KAJ2143556.1 RNA polymerase subunit AC19 [Coemansia sp. RSA 564]KAJ2152306.1 RNA polymerase subunit AC19 [Coemansia sp. RSA 637]KAJ2164151.1 RNA polymerase subunit AC19 [Coemansia sp
MDSDHEMDVDAVDETKRSYIALLSVPTDKITVVPGASSDLTSMTFSIKDEDHTLGNSLRWMIMQNPRVDFCGYSIPHPSEAKLHIRIQTHSTSAVRAMQEGIDDLNSVCGLVKAKFLNRVAEMKN